MRIDELIDPNSDQFLKWFNGSKVADKKGNPLMMYHATDASANFKTFKPMSHFGDLDTAHDVVNLRSPGEDIVKNMRIIPVYINIKNPMVLPDSGAQHSAWRIVKQMRKEGIIDERMEDGLYLKWQREHGEYWQFGYNRSHSNKQDAKNWGKGEALRMKDLIKLIKHLGYDGFKYKNTKEGKGTESWVPLANRQVRFAI